MSWTCVQWNSSSPSHRRHCNMSDGSMETNFMLFWHGKEQKTENGSLSTSRVDEMLCWINNITQGRAHREQSKNFIRCAALLRDSSRTEAKEHSTSHKTLCRWRLKRSVACHGSAELEEDTAAGKKSCKQSSRSALDTTAQLLIDGRENMAVEARTKTVWRSLESRSVIC